MLLRVWCQKIWETNKILPVLVSALAVLTLGLYLLGNWWLEPRSEKLKSQLAQRQKVLNRIAGSGGRKLPVREVLKRGRADVKMFWDKIPERADFPKLINDVSSLARMAGLKVNRIQYNPEEIPGKKMLRYELNFSVTGEYPKVKKFIYLIEKSGRIISIDEVSFQGKNEAQSSSVQMSIRLSTLFKK
jgi:Tfp pilus assembly protein PilO